MGIIRRSRDRLSIRVYTVPPGPPPDLVAESKERAASGEQAALQAGPYRDWNDPSERGTAYWPDPHGLDPVVFPPRGGAR